MAIKDGDHVGFKYRSAKHPTGRVEKILKRGKDAAHTMLEIRPDKDSRHKGESHFIHRRASKVHKI